MTSVEVCDICGKTANQYIVYNNVKRCDECYDKFMRTTYDPVEQRIRQLELDVNMLKAAIGRSEPEYPTFTTGGSFTPDVIPASADSHMSIAELEVELAKLRELIGFIPKGKSCRGCDSNVGTIGDYYTTSLCDLFGEFCFNDEKCAACIAAFPNGNKGE